MNREEFVKKVDSKLKLIRNEKGFTQDKMAETIGVSKKTLIQIEKERSSLGWTGAVAVCSIFKYSEILQLTFGGDPQDIILSLAFKDQERKHSYTLGGKVWWRDIKTKGGYKIQQNVISKHYRILDSYNRRISYSFEIGDIKNKLDELQRGDKDGY